MKMSWEMIPFFSSSFLHTLTGVAAAVPLDSVFEWTFPFLFDWLIVRLDFTPFAFQASAPSASRFCNLYDRNSAPAKWLSIFSLHPVRPFIAHLIDANYDELFTRQGFCAKQNQRETNRRYEQLLVSVSGPLFKPGLECSSADTYRSLIEPGRLTTWFFLGMLFFVLQSAVAWSPCRTRRFPAFLWG